jgi:hypothetical protein
MRNFVAEIPQSSERIRGRANMRTIQRTQWVEQMDDAVVRWRKGMRGKHACLRAVATPFAG